MDSLPSKVKFAFTNLASTIDDSAQWWQILLRIVADFEITFEGRLFYSEREFPIVEFAAQCRNWIAKTESTFNYNSMESDDNPLVSFQLGPNGLYTITSPHSNFVSSTQLTKKQLTTALNRFCQDVQNRVHDELRLRFDLEYISKQIMHK